MDDHKRIPPWKLEAVLVVVVLAIMFALMLMYFG